MAIWNVANSVLTDKGAEVLAKVQAGIGKLEISRAVAGSVKVDETSLTKQTSVTNIKQNLRVVKVEGTADGSIIGLQLDNAEIEESFDLWQIGIYVEHPDFDGEILYYLSQATRPDEIPLPTVTPAIFNYNLYVKHTNVPEITVVIDPSGTVGVGEFNNHVNDMFLHNSFVEATGNGSSISAVLEGISNSAIPDGLSVVVRVPAALETGATFTLNSFSASNIVTANGENVQSGTVSAGAIIPMSYDRKTRKWYLTGAGGLSSETDDKITNIDTTVNETNETVNNISNSIGSYSDNSETDSIFGKLKKTEEQLTDLQTKTGTFADNNAQETIFGSLTTLKEKSEELKTKSDGLSSKIGTSDDTSSTTNTLFGKIKKVQEDVTSSISKIDRLLTDWTTARAGKIDTIDTNAARLTEQRAGYIDKIPTIETKIGNVESILTKM